MKDSFVELFKENQNHAEELGDELSGHGDGQNPETVTVSCSDSRVLHDHSWNNETPGEIFTVGNIGNRVYQKTEKGDKVVSGDMIYPVAHTDTENMVVVGHTGCGAVTATYQHLTGQLDYENEPEGIQRCIDLLKPYVEEGLEQLPDDLEDEEAVNRLVEYNVDRQVEFLIDSEEVPEHVNVIGAVYDLHNVYESGHGYMHLSNLNGENSTETLKDNYPEIKDQVNRLWEP